MRVYRKGGRIIEKGRDFIIIFDIDFTVHEFLDFKMTLNAVLCRFTPQLPSISLRITPL